MTGRKCSLPALFVFLFAVSPVGAAVVNFYDDFEGPVLDPFWTVEQQMGSIALSTDQAVSGIQSAKFTSTSGGQRDIALSHTFAQALSGSASLSVYDFSPGQQTLYHKLAFYDSSNPNFVVSIGIQDFDAFCYSAAAVDSGGSLFGPNAACGVFPQTTTADVTRTLGWHTFGASVSVTGLDLRIDGQSVFTLPGVFQFDRIEFRMSGPGSRPNTMTYIDDFSVDGTTVPEPASFGLIATALAGLAWIRRSRARAGGVKL